MARVFACVGLLFAVVSAHISITSPIVGVRPLPDDNTNPCTSGTPTSPRYSLQAPATVLPIRVFSSDTHGGGQVSLTLGYGSNPALYNITGPTAQLTTSMPSATLNWTLSYDAAEGNYGTIQVYFSGGSNYQCLDVMWQSAPTNPPTAPPSPSPPSPTPPTPYVAWPVGVIGRSLTSGGSASYFKFTQYPNNSQVLCGWEYNPSSWRSWASWFNPALGSYDSATVVYQVSTEVHLLVNHTYVGTYNFGICPHEDVSAPSYITLFGVLTARDLRVVQLSAQQLLVMYACKGTLWCQQPTAISTINATTGVVISTSFIPHVSAIGATYDYANGIYVISDVASRTMWFFDNTMNAFGLSNFSGLIDYFLSARISSSKNKTYVLAAKNKTAILYSVDMKSGNRVQIPLSANTIGTYYTLDAFSFVLDEGANILWGTYSTGSNGLLSINLNTGEVAVASLPWLDPLGLVLHV